MMHSLVDRIYLKYWRIGGHHGRCSAPDSGIHKQGAIKKGDRRKREQDGDRAENKGKELETQEERLEDMKVTSTKQSFEQYGGEIKNQGLG